MQQILIEVNPSLAPACFLKITAKVSEDYMFPYQASTVYDIKSFNLLCRLEIEISFSAKSGDLLVASFSFY